MDYEILLYGTILFVLVFLVPAFQRPRRTALWSVKLAQLDVRLQSAEKRENDDDRDAGYVDYAFSGVAADGQSVAGDARVLAHTRMLGGGETDTATVDVSKLQAGTDYTFFIFLAVLILLYCAAGSYALIISTIFSDKQLAVTLTPVLIIPFMLFAGFFVNQNNIPIWLIEFQYLSFFKYGYQALMINEYQGWTLACQDLEITNPGHCDPLKDFDSPQTLGESIIALAAMYVGCYTISLIIMKMLSRKYE